MKQNDDWISASDIGRAAYCPEALAHKHAGTAVSVQAVAARRRGDEAHDQLNRQAEDKRCYIASHVWGSDDPRTVRLRSFRDEHLIPNRIGRALVTTYYWLSPSLVDVARCCRPFDALLRRIVTLIVMRLEPRGSGDE